MNAVQRISTTERYARCVETSKRVRWKVEEDVIRGRRFDTAHKFLPDGLIAGRAFTTLSAGERRFFSQIQGRTYANMFGLVERFINAKVLELSRDHWFGDQVALEALVRFSDEELKHQALFRRVEAMIGDGAAGGLPLHLDPNDVARAVLGKRSWAVLALTLHIELFTQPHYRESIEPDAELSELFKDVFLYHWKEESQHAILDELEWRREDAADGGAARPRGRRTDRAGRRGGWDPAGAGPGRRRLFLAACGRRRRCRGAGDRGSVPRRLPLAIHPLGRPAPAIRQGADEPDHRHAGPTHPGRARHAPIGPAQARALPTKETCHACPQTRCRSRTSSTASMSTTCMP